MVMSTVLAVLVRRVRVEFKLEVVDSWRCGGDGGTLRHDGLMGYARGEY